MCFFKYALPALALLTLVFVTGCGGEASSVTGAVTLDGEPLGGVDVVFIPVEGKGANSVATTDADGSYTLTYTSTEKGAIPGKYMVQVMKLKQTDEGEVETLPARYNVDSTLTAEVTTSGDNHFVFELESE